MKRNAIARIILYSIAILLLGSILLGGLILNTVATNFEWDNFLQGSWTDAGGELSSVGSVPSSEIRNIQIDWSTGSITIVPGDVDAITYQETGCKDDNDRMVLAMADDTLIIHFTNTRVFWGITIDTPKDLLITVPRDWSCNELEIDVASAQVTIRDLTIETVDFDGASGVCKFENSQVGHLDMDTASGDVRFNGMLQELDLDAASASCTLVLTQAPKRIDADMASGDLDITLPENSGFSMKLDAVSGDFSSDFPTTIQNDCHVYGDGSCRINVSAMSGDVVIRKAEDSAG